MSEYTQRVVHEFFSLGPRSLRRRSVRPPAIEGYSVVRRALAETFGFELKPKELNANAEVQLTGDDRTVSVALFGLSAEEIGSIRHRARFGPVTDKVFKRLHTMDSLLRLLRSLGDAYTSGENALQLLSSPRGYDLRHADPALGDLVDGCITAFEISKQLDIPDYKPNGWEKPRIAQTLELHGGSINALAPLLAPPRYSSGRTSLLARRTHRSLLRMTVNNLKTDLEKTRSVFARESSIQFDVSQENFHNLLIPVDGYLLLSGMVWSDDTNWPDRVGAYVRSHSVLLASGLYRVQPGGQRERERELV